MGNVVIQPKIALVGDIGGTCMRIGVASEDTLIDHAIVRTPHDPDEFFQVLGHVITGFVELYSVDNGAIGFPGPVKADYNGVTVGPLPNVAGIEEAFNVNERLAAEHSKLRGFGILALNDAEAATHAAAHVAWPDIKNESSIVTYITQSTGVGGDSIKNGVVSSRADGHLAEYGHMPFLQPDGTYATLENRVSGEAIRKIYGHGTLTAQQLYKDPDTGLVWQTVGKDFAKGLSVLAPVIGMADIVIGGGTSRCHPRYQKSLRQELDTALEAVPSSIIEKAPDISYVPSNMIDTLGLRGAFYALQQRYLELA